MNAESLLASAAINIGLAFVILSLFSVFKRQPSNAGIYYARRLALGHHIPFDHSFTLRRFLPSVSWISRAIYVTEDEILEISGLDGLVFIRLFKFGINFFSICSLVGLVILLPLNYTAHDGPSKSSDSMSMDSFSISNVDRGSDRLWVHFVCLWIISVYGLYLLYKEYDDILKKRIQQLCNNRHRPDQLTVLVREIPVCEEHKAHGCCVEDFFSKHHAYAYGSYQILYDGKNLDELLKEAKRISRKIENLRHHPVAKNRNKEFTLSDSIREDAKIARYGERLDALCQKIGHIQCRKLFEEKELPVAFVTFRNRWGAALAAQSQQNSNPLLWITEMAPEPRDVLWRNLAIPYKHLPLHKIGVYTAASLLTLFFTIPVTAIQGIAKYERLKKWFPPAMAIRLIPGLGPVITGYLPSAILTGFIYIVPFAMLAMAKLAGYVSRSKKEIKACNMVFYFLVGNVFFLSLLSGTLLDQIGQSFTHPKDFPSRLASAVSAQADFFMTYILTNGLAGFSLEILQPGLLIWDSLKSCTCDREKGTNLYLYSLPYYRYVPLVSLSILIGMVYSVVAPLLLPLLIVYFFLGYVVFINQIEDVYETTYETCGQYWPYIHRYIFLAIVLTQISMMGLFGLKSKPAASFATIPLLLFTLMFNEYCKMRFNPTFFNYPVQEAKRNDELDEKSGLLEANYQKALDAYCPPCLRPVKFTLEESSSSQPFISST
ncbi:CSC1-like protein At3g54510 isoform X1 [Rhododendron vialii]|uniref:CSC1-like protein At3g54510 isoform X1 n=2 Tax=Rhododendron vialii TaxID=182163 RepID=UPI00265E514F|nr:CSC1-like protein At3g54510 isoform X1 [Rhododendron vialii]